MINIQPIPNLLGYFISENGDLLSAWRHAHHGGLLTNRLKLIFPTQNSNGYFYKTFGKKLFFIHNLILTTFKGSRPQGMQGCHKNDIKWDNRISNLYWGTPKQNDEDRIKNGHYSFSKEDIEGIFCLRRNGFTQVFIAKLFNTSQPHISKICAGIHYSIFHLSYK